jgi:hypothetical protein
MSNVESKRKRIFRATNESPAALSVEENAAYLIGNKSNFIVADDRGVTVSGPVSFVSDSMHRRSSGLFVGMTDFLQMIPSTIVTPIPHRLLMPPLHMLQYIQRDLAFFMAALMSAKPA